MIEQKETAGVSGIIYIIENNEGRLLLVKRIKPGSNFFGQYLFPAGMCEDYDRTTLDTVTREVMKERGIEIAETNTCSLGTVTYLHPKGCDITLEIFLYLALLIKVKLKI